MLLISSKIFQTKKKIEAKLTEYAFVDPLTHLPNRRYFDDHLRRQASKARRNQEKLGLLFIDLDHFKPINDAYGHDIGDLVLREISDRLFNMIRAEDLLARIGGDEFVLAISPVPDLNYLDQVAKRILEACNKPMLFNQLELKLSASIGISTNQTLNFEEQHLLKLADQAMYAAKKQGGNCFSHATDS